MTHSARTSLDAHPMPVERWQQAPFVATGKFRRTVETGCSRSVVFVGIDIVASDQVAHQRLSVEV